MKDFTDYEKYIFLKYIVNKYINTDEEERDYTRRILEEIIVEILNIGGSNECNNK